MRKVLPDGLIACLICGEELEGALIDFEMERGEAQPDCDLCKKAS
jgi:hypothetical protein